MSAQGELFRAPTPQQTEQGELCTARGAGVGTKLSRLAASASPTGTKLSQRARNTHFRRILRQQGEFYTASTTTKPSRANKVTHQHPTSPHQRSPPPISHAIHLNELSKKPRNVAIPTITIQISKYSQGNCMRNWRGRIRGWRQGQSSNTRPTGTPDWRPPRGLRGLARLRDDAPNQTSATQAPLVWRAPVGPEGQGGPRDRPLRAKLACGDLAGGRARRRPEHPWGHQQQRAARTTRGRAAAHGHTKQPGPQSTRGAQNTSGATSTAVNQAGVATPKTRWNNRRRNIRGAAASDSQAPSDAPTLRPRPSARAGARRRRRPGRGPRPRR